MKVQPWDTVPAEPVAGMPGVSIRWVVGKDDGAERFAMRVFDVQPGAAIPRHEHWYEQEMFILSGRGTATVGEEAQEVAPGSVVWIEPEAPHAFENTSEDVLRFICCVPLQR